MPPAAFRISVGLARTIYIRCTYGIFGREITIHTAIYGVYIRFWPTLNIILRLAAPKQMYNNTNVHPTYGNAQRYIYTQHTTVYIHTTHDGIYIQNRIYTNIQQHKRSSNVQQHTTVYIHNGVYTHNTQRYIYTTVHIQTYNNTNVHPTYGDTQRMPPATPRRQPRTAKCSAACRSTLVHGGDCNRMSVGAVSAQLLLWKPPLLCLYPSRGFEAWISATPKAPVWILRDQTSFTTYNIQQTSLTTYNKQQTTFNIQALQQTTYNKLYNIQALQHTSFTTYNKQALQHTTYKLFNIQHTLPIQHTEHTANAPSYPQCVRLDPTTEQIMLRTTHTVSLIHSNTQQMPPAASKAAA